MSDVVQTSPMEQRSVLRLSYHSANDFLFAYASTLAAGFVELPSDAVVRDQESIQVFIKVGNDGVGCSLSAVIEAVRGYPPRAHFSNPRVLGALAASFASRYQVRSTSEFYRRKGERIKQQLFVSYYSRDEVLADVCLNFSKDGMFIRSDDPLPCGTLVHLEAMLPNGDEVQVDGKVVRSVDSGDNKGMGVQFYRFIGTSKATLEAYIDKQVDSYRASSLLMN